MLAVKILKNLVKKAQKPKAKVNNPTLGKFNVDVNPSMSQIINQVNQGRSTTVSVKFSGDLPSASSELAQNLSSLGVAYGISNLVLEKRTNPKFGSYGEDIPAVLGISLGSWAASNFLQYYVFDSLLGNAIPETSITLDVDSASDLEKSNLLTNPEISGEIIEKGITGLVGAELVSQVWDFFEFFANAYHGYQRHDKSVLAGIGWGLFGNVGMALQQGYGLPMESKGESRFLDMPQLAPIQNPKRKTRKPSKKASSKISARKVRSRKTSKKTRKSHKARKTK